MEYAHAAVPAVTNLWRVATSSRTVARWLAHQRHRARSGPGNACENRRSEEHTSELQSHRDLHSFPTRRSSDLHKSLARRDVVSHGGSLARPSKTSSAIWSWKRLRKQTATAPLQRLLGFNGVGPSSRCSFIG